LAERMQAARWRVIEMRGGSRLVAASRVKLNPEPRLSGFGGGPPLAQEDRPGPSRVDAIERTSDS
jgi:hypothetical protein